MAADRPQEIRAAKEQRVFLPRQQPGIDERLVGVDAVIVLGDPEERLQVALPALSFLDVRLDEVARLADAGEPRIALGELGGDELARRAGHHLVLEARLQLAKKRLVAGDRTRLEQRGADGHVLARRLQRLVYRARRVPDLQPKVPEHVEDVFRDALRPGGLLPGKEEEQVDVGMRRKRAAPVAADRDQRQPLGGRRIARREDVGRGDSQTAPR